MSVNTGTRQVRAAPSPVAERSVRPRNQTNCMERMGSRLITCLCLNMSVCRASIFLPACPASCGHELEQFAVITNRRPASGRDFPQGWRRINPPSLSQNKSGSDFIVSEVRSLEHVPIAMCLASIMRFAPVPGEGRPGLFFQHQVCADFRLISARGSVHARRNSWPASTHWWHRHNGTIAGSNRRSNPRRARFGHRCWQEEQIWLKTTLQATKKLVASMSWRIHFHQGAAVGNRSVACTANPAGSSCHPPGF